MSPLAPSLALIGGFGLGELILILGVLILLFGAKKLPMLARGLGAGIRNFKGELHDGSRDSESDQDHE